MSHTSRRMMCWLVTDTNSGPTQQLDLSCSAFQRPCLRLSTPLHHNTSCAGTARWQRPWIACPLNHPKRMELLRMLGWLKGSIWSNLRYTLLLEALDRGFEPYFAQVSPPALCKCLCLPGDAKKRKRKKEKLPRLCAGAALLPATGV